MNKGGATLVFFGALLTLIGLGAFAYAFGSRGREGSRRPSATESALDTLKRRYVNGQIQRDEFLRMKRDLER
jgi:uncharacterized membrane protein